MKYALVSLLLVLLATPAFGEDSPSVTFTSELRTGFILSSAARVSDSFWMNDIFLHWDSGVTFDVTLLTSLEDPGFASQDFGNELDFVLGLPLGKAGGLKLGTYQLAPVEKTDNDFWILAWSKSFGGLSATAEYLGGIGDDAFSDKAFLKLDYAKSVDIGQKASLSLPVRLVWDSGIDGGGDAFILRFRPELSFAIRDGMTGYVGWEGHQPLTDRENRDFQNAWRLGFRVTF